MPTLSPIPSDLPQSFTVAQALDRGVGAGRLRSNDLARPFAGVRVREALPPVRSLEQRMRRDARVYAPRLRPGQFFCEATAIALHGLPLPLSRSEDVVHVATSPSASPPRASGVAGHRFSASVIVRDGMPVCSPVDAWSQCAAAMTETELIVLGDALVRRDRPLCTMAELEAHVRACAGRRGARKLVRALARIRPRTDSPMETLTRLVLVSAGLPEPAVNDVVRDGAGNFLGYGDLVYPQWKIVIEYEGGYHFEGEQPFRDIDRLARFVAAGWRVIRVHKYHLANPAELIAHVRSAIAARS